MKKKVIITIIIIIICGIFHVSEAQEMLGLTNTSYSGLSGISLNPANISQNSKNTEIGILTINVSGENNIFYIKKDEYKFTRFFEKHPNFPKHGINNNFATYFLSDNKHKRFVLFNLRIAGPSVLFHIRHHSFAFQTALRSAFSIYNLPIPLAANIHTGFIVRPQFNAGEFKSAGLLWGETNLSYSYKTARYTNVFAFGITLKKLSGYGGAYLINNNMIYGAVSNATVVINNFNGEYAYSLPLDYSNNEFSTNNILKGSGFGFDVGFVFLKRIKKQLAFKNTYKNKYKLGVSLLDIGKIKFKQKVNKYIFDNSNTYWPNADSFMYDNLFEFDSTVISNFNIPTGNIYRNSDFSIFLPSALSVQFDYNIYNNWYVNTTVMQAFNIGKVGVRRISFISLIPRYETKNFAIQMPMTYYEKQYTRIGLAVRIFRLTIGTEKITGFFNYDDFTGLDFYLSLIFNASDFKSLKNIYIFKRKPPCYDLKF
ncbi:MAG: hypothetical protein J7J86_06490 [Bacteroidales bacterium]|nr:hypothetical protein [Bacteroidales bacterium]